ncbi:MAG: hypothetical protein LBB13_00365 [Rickettsiales bacterium]|jgi:hypothetical protein|nr:hypothetical protein [Rickettsiales bacterium]
MVDKLDSKVSVKKSYRQEVRKSFTGGSDIVSKMEIPEKIKDTEIFTEIRSGSRVSVGGVDGDIISHENREPVAATHGIRFGSM